MATYRVVLVDSFAPRAHEVQDILEWYGCQVRHILACDYERELKSRCDLYIVSDDSVEAGLLIHYLQDRGYPRLITYSRGESAIGDHEDMPGYIYMPSKAAVDEEILTTAAWCIFKKRRLPKRLRGKTEGYEAAWDALYKAWSDDYVSRRTRC